MSLEGEALNAGAALAVGLLVGIERGWKLRDAPEGTRVAGVRTFTLLGLLAGLAGLVSSAGHVVAGGSLVAAAAAVLAIGYGRKLDAEDQQGATTPIAGLVTLGLGFLAGSGNPSLAIAVATLVTLLLALRTEAHGLIERLDEQDVKALMRYAVIAGAVLPFLPEGDYGPYGAWNLRQLWLVVVLVTGFSFIGYAANRIFGARHGTLATAIIGGAYSSTAVTQSLAQRMGSGQGGGAEPAGIALASAVMYLRVLLLVAVLATRVLVDFAILILPATLVGAGAGYWLYRKAEGGEKPVPPGNPIEMLPALGFLLFVAVATVGARWAEGRFGDEGIALLIFIMGSLHVDAAIVTLGGLPTEAISPALAALALGGTILANMSVKLGITIAYGRSRGTSAALALGASMGALAVSLVVAWLRL